MCCDIGLPEIRGTFGIYNIEAMTRRHVLIEPLLGKFKEWKDGAGKE